MENNNEIKSIEDLLNNPDFIIRLLQEIQKLRLENAALRETVGIQKQLLSEMEHTTTYYDIILACTEAVDLAAIARDYGKSEQWMSTFLCQLGVHYKRGRSWLLCPQYVDRGYTRSRIVVYNDNGIEHSQLLTRWRQSGRLFIYELLKDQGILPLIEQGNADGATRVKITKRKGSHFYGTERTA